MKHFKDFILHNISRQVTRNRSRSFFGGWFTQKDPYSIEKPFGGSENGKIYITKRYTR